MHTQQHIQQYRTQAANNEQQSGKQTAKKRITQQHKRVTHSLSNSIYHIIHLLSVFLSRHNTIKAPIFLSLDSHLDYGSGILKDETTTSNFKVSIFFCGNGVSRL
jgi:hypothetical protein